MTPDRLELPSSSSTTSGCWPAGVGAGWCAGVLVRSTRVRSRWCSPCPPCHPPTQVCSLAISRFFSVVSYSKIESENKTPLVWPSRNPKSISKNIFGSKSFPSIPSFHVILQNLCNWSYKNPSNLEKNVQIHAQNSF